ncbi:hypothetical protein Leryth_007228 [Lithospermum erythrorhizon]|nr:hypothetical protein Leryth_007228 [Lithospermum erythrorhizon]
MWGVNVQPYIGLLLPGDRIMGLDTPSGGNTSHGFYLPNGRKLEERAMDLRFAVFPALQGGPHNNHIAALAIALKQVATQEYMVYMNQVKRNAKALASALLNRNSRLVTGGTDTHLLLWDLRPLALTGKNFEKVCELCHITVNKTTLFDDNGTITPGGVRIVYWYWYSFDCHLTSHHFVGTPAMTTRDYLLTAAKITSSLQREYGKAFVKGFDNKKDILELGLLVESFASQFAMPGFDI